MYQLECVNLNPGYDGHPVCENLNFQVSAGDYLCIVGENGSGKSTLIKTLLGLQPPVSGSVKTGDGLKQKQIGYLPQQTAVQKDFPASVFEIVISGCINQMGLRPFYGKKEKAIATDNMKKMGIADFSAKSYRNLSGGQQQRVLLARALCATGKMLLLDEPVSGLDPVGSNEMYELINELNKEGITVLMVSHDMNAAIKYASHILHIGQTQLFFGKKSDYIKTPLGQAFTTIMGGNKNE